MVSISQIGRQGSKTAMAQVEVQMEAATSNTNLSRKLAEDKNSQSLGRCGSRVGFVTIFAHFMKK